MLAGAPLIGFVGTVDLAASRAFYREVLGLQLRESTPYADVYDAGGTMLRVTLVEDVAAVPYTVLGWDVDDVAATVAELTGRGVTFRRYEALEQDQAGIWPAPGGAKVAWFTDPDGNTLSVSQHARG